MLWDIETSKSCAKLQGAWRHSGVLFFDNFPTAAFQKGARGPHVLNILTCKCASRHSGVQFCQIQTSKSAPSLRCFAHFDLQMCFAPQRRAIFHIPTSKSAPKARCFVHFYLKCASRHSGVPFSCLLCAATSARAALASLLFDPADTQNLGKKHSMSRLS